MTWQDDLRDTADALTDSYLHRETVHVWDHHRHRRTRHWQTRQPGLLAQLHHAAHHPLNCADDGSTSSGKPGSRPPLAVEALSVHDEITGDIRRRCTALGLVLRPTVESNLRQLCAKAVSFDEPAGRALLADLRRWRRWCLVMTGWEHVRRLRNVTCPECHAAGTLRVNLTTATAGCTGCGAAWARDDGNLHTLARHAAPAAF